MNSRLTIALLVSAVPLLSGCIGLAPTESPIPSIETANAAARNGTLIIMLPGRGDRAETFIEQGFQQHGQRLGFDSVAVDAHFGYYMERSLLPRLHEDVVLPARAAGYQNIWLLGISMGGFGSVLYASEHPELIDGVILLAPFLGERAAIEEVAANGGLGGWNSDESRLEDYEKAIWSWLGQVTSEPGKKPLILGYGLSDRLAGAYGVLLDVLEPSSIYTLEGGHNWTTWQPLWEKIAADLEF